MKNVLFLVLLCSLASCSSTKTSPAREAQAARVQELINNKKININAVWAHPQPDNVLNQLGANNLLGAGNTAGRIYLLGSSQTFKLINDSAQVYLPFYGERRLSGGYNSSNAVEFSGPVTDFKSEKNEKKKRTELSFTAQETGENYNVNIDIYDSGRASIVVNSTHRSFIRYEGELLLDNIEGE